MWPCAVAGPAPLAPLHTQSRLAHVTTLTAQNLLLMLLDLLGGHAQRAFKFSARMTSETSSMFRRSNSIISENRSVARGGGGGGFQPPIDALAKGLGESSPICHRPLITEPRCDYVSGTTVVTFARNAGRPGKVRESYAWYCMCGRGAAACVATSPESWR